MKKSAWVFLAAVVAGCAAGPQQIHWTRIGPPVSAYQIDADFAVCRSVASAQASQPQRPQTIVVQQSPTPQRGLGLADAADSFIGARSARDAHDAALFGCMAERGWVVRSR